MGCDVELLGQLAIAQDFEYVETAFGQILGSQASSVTSSPASKASSICPTLTTATLSAQRLLNPRLGTRRTNGIVPP